MSGRGKRFPANHARLIHMASKGGHRGEYQGVLALTLDLQPSEGKVFCRNFVRLVRAKSVLFGSLDDDLRGFLAVAISRMFMKKKTVGLFIRPQSCFIRGNVKSFIKFHLFFVLSKFKTISIFTILPFEIQPEYRKIASGGLADPQLWDRSIILPKPSVEFCDRIRAFAGGRRVLAFIGTAFLHKGLKELRNLMANPAWNNTVCVVLAGRIPDQSGAIVSEIEALGALVLPRFATTEEIDAIYEMADFVWAAYDPSYDQASGIFGRAIQFGKPPIVRRGALVERFADVLDCPSIAINFEKLQDCVEQLQRYRSKSPPLPPANVVKFRDAFFEAMERAL